MYVYVCMYTCMHACMYVCMHVCIYVCMPVCIMYVSCMYVSTYTCGYLYGCVDHVYVGLCMRNYSEIISVECNGLVYYLSLETV